MPRTLNWRWMTFALIGAAAVVGLVPARAKADTLVARLAGTLGDQQAVDAVSQPAPTVDDTRGQTTWVGFNSYDPGPARPGPTAASAAARKALLLRQAFQNRAALAALILMVGNIPQMPPVEIPAAPLLSGPPDQGRASTPVDTPTPPASTTPEPAAWLLALLGLGVVGGYALLRRSNDRLGVCPV